MNSKDITLWIDKRWYDALSKHLKDETLEEHLEDVIDEMCNQLPQREYERISAEIWQEDQEERKAREVNCTPFVRQYDILDNKWGASLCQKEYQTNDTRQNLRN